MLSPAVPAEAQRPAPPRQVRPARVLLAAAALAAALSAVWALAGLPWAERDTALVEAWRAYLSCRGWRT